MRTVARPGAAALLAIAILLALAYANRFSLLAWFSMNGGLGLVSELREPVLEPRDVRWSSKSVGVAGATPSRPNIIVILADDLGWNDISFYGGGIGNGIVGTPNIDRIAAEGVHFSRGYAGNATCAPSRAALLTGRYPTRYGFEFTPVPASFMKMRADFEPHRAEPRRPIILEENWSRQGDYRTHSVPADELFLPEILNAAGYHSVMLGKWHLGENEGHTPNDQGFDEFLGFLSGGAMFAEPDDPEIVNSIQAFDPIDQHLWPNVQFAVRFNRGQRFRPDEYMTDYLSTQAVRVIQANRDRPFFLYLSYNAPHTPLQATRSDYDALPTIENHTERVYGAMVRALDRGIGRVLDALETEGLAENTLVVFSSDNGGAHYIGVPGLNAPYRGWKMTFFEGGLRVPFLMRWPARIAAGSEFSEPATQFDFFTTAVRAAGAEIPADRAIDGADLVPFVTGEKAGAPHDGLFWRTGTYRAALHGGWKLQLSDPDQTPFLYHLAQDPTERHNLADTEPEQLSRMMSILEKGMAEWVEPQRPPLVGSPMYPDKHLNEPLDDADDFVYWYN